MAWGDCQLPVGDEVYLYYGGYAQGHKVERFTERQIGMVRIRRDRYVAREAGAAGATLRTRRLVLNANAVTLNVDAARGQVRVQVVGVNGKPVPGFAFADNRPVTRDALAAPVLWAKPLSALQGRTVRLEFALRKARLFGFELNE
jgi:hypothetical protein